MRAILGLNSVLFYSFFSFFFLFHLANTFVQQAQEMINEKIEKREQKVEYQRDALDVMIDWQSPDGQNLTQEAIRDEIKTYAIIEKQRKHNEKK